MQETFTIEQKTFPLSIRLPFLVVGLLLLTLGLKGVVDGSTILTSSFSGEPSWPTHFAVGLLITLVSTGLGCAFVWAFCIPSKKVIIVASNQEVNVAYRYPLGVSRDDVFALGDIKTPEIVWHRNSEYSEGGYWRLKLTMPDGRAVTQSSDFISLSEQKEQAEAWKTEIQALRR